MNEIETRGRKPKSPEQAFTAKVMVNLQPHVKAWLYTQETSPAVFVRELVNAAYEKDMKRKRREGRQG